jgi:hypothetical protein
LARAQRDDGAVRRALLPATLAVTVVFALSLLGCSGGDDDGQSAVAGPSPVTEASPTSTITSAVVSLATTTPTTASATTPPSTVPPTTPVPSPPPAGPSSGPYTPVDAPAFPTRSAPPPSDDSWPDGEYYVVVRGAAADAPTPRLAITAYQVLTGPDAIAAAQADGVGLDSDVYIPASPSADRDIELTADLPISVARPDRPGVSYAITAGELARLVNGASPEEGAPEGYAYVEFPFLLTVQGGQPVALQQLWAP